MLQALLRIVTTRGLVRFSELDWGDPKREFVQEVLARAQTDLDTLKALRLVQPHPGDFVSQRTFSIIKPDAVRKGLTGAILAQVEKAGFKLVAIKKLHISEEQAKGFYHVHAARPFFADLTKFMSSGPIFPMVLEKENAIADLRKLMGATNPANAEEGTIRKMFADSIEENAIHGSDAEDTAEFEIGYFFAGLELK